MKRIHLLVLALVAAFAFSVVAAAAASAAPEWLIDGTTPVGKVPVESTLSSVLLEDIGTEVQVLAEGIQLGTVEAGGKDEITGFTVQSAIYERPKSCEGNPTVKAVHLNYATSLELVVENNVDMIWDDIKKVVGATTEPGWEVECKVSPFTFKDVCVSEKGRVLVENDGAGGVFATFDNTVKAKCSGAPGSTEGTIESEGGAALILEPAGLSLEVDP